MLPACAVTFAVNTEGLKARPIVDVDPWAEHSLIHDQGVFPRQVDGVCGIFPGEATGPVANGAGHSAPGIILLRTVLSQSKAELKAFRSLAVIAPEDDLPVASIRKGPLVHGRARELEINLLNRRTALQGISPSGNGRDDEGRVPVHAADAHAAGICLRRRLSIPAGIPLNFLHPAL